MEVVDLSEAPLATHCVRVPSTVVFCTTPLACPGGTFVWARGSVTTHVFPTEGEMLKAWVRACTGRWWLALSCMFLFAGGLC